MTFSKNENKVYKTSCDNPMLNLFEEFLKIINCESRISNDEITIWDSFYTPTITLGGKKFAFDANDIETNALFGENGKKYTVPFEYTTNDNLRKVKCDELGANNNSFSIHLTKLDNRNREVGFTKLNVSQKEDNFIEIHIQQNKNGIYLKFKLEKNKKINCLIRVYNYTNTIDNKIEIEYKEKWSSNEKTFKIYNSHINRLSHENFTTLVKFSENSLTFSSDNRNGYYLVQHTDSEKREEIKELNLDETELDLYFEDLCFHSKEFISVLKSNLSSLSSNFWNILYQNYPSFKLFLEKIENSQDRGILNNVLKAYLKRKEKLGLKKELKFIPN